MSVEFILSFEPLTPMLLDAFERCNDIALPARYREFLLRHNGGRPSPNMFLIPDLGEHALLDFLFGIRQGAECGLQAWLDEYGDEIPEGFLVIGTDPGGNLLLLETTGAQREQIYYWDSQLFFEGSSEHGNAFPIAENIDELLNSLRPVVGTPDRNEAPVIRDCSRSETEMTALDPLDVVRESLADSVPAVREGIIEVMSCAVVPFQRAMIALRSHDELVDPIEACAANDCASALSVDEVVLVRWDASQERLITNAFTNVTVQQVLITSDPDEGTTLAKVVVSEPELDAAFGPEGIFPRLAAMLAHVNIRIVTPDELND